MKQKLVKKREMKNTSKCFLVKAETACVNFRSIPKMTSNTHKGGRKQHHPKEEGGRQHHARGGGSRAPPERGEGGREGENNTTPTKGWVMGTALSSTTKKVREEKAAPPHRRRSNHLFTSFNLPYFNALYLCLTFDFVQSSYSV